MSDAATPDAEKNNAGNPPAPAPATPATSESEKVTLTKEEHDQLVRDAARAKRNQSKADLYDQTFGKGGRGNFKPVQPVTPPTEEEIADRLASEDRKAERGLLAIAADPAFREVFDADPTLRNLILTNPLAVLPMFAPDALDADDAINLVKDKLNRLKKPATPPATPPAEPDPSKIPPAGGINPTDREVNEEYENAKKLPNTESAIAGMIKVSMKKGGK